MEFLIARSFGEVPWAALLGYHVGQQSIRYTFDGGNVVYSPFQQPLKRPRIAATASFFDQARPCSRCNSPMPHALQACPPLSPATVPRPKRWPYTFCGGAVGVIDIILRRECNCLVEPNLRFSPKQRSAHMKPIEKDEIYEHLCGFLKAKGVELKDGSYSQTIQKSCSILADAINLSQRGIEKAKTEIDQKLDRMRQVIHEKTAPRKSAGKPVRPESAASSSTPPPILKTAASRQRRRKPAGKKQKSAPPKG
jgi:hypothetical protein